jgi:dephospho-CoA kinase
MGKHSIQRPMIIGLTGGIGMGKSTAAKILRDLGLPVHNADDAVHALLRKGGKAVKPVAKYFPESFKGGAIDRKILGKLVFNNSRKLKQLEKILHPLVHKSEADFLRKVRKRKIPAAILEIPLLFETGAEKRCDFTICVMAPKPVQKARVMKRPGMTPERFKAILSRQMPDSEKQKRADLVVQTGKGIADTKKRFIYILSELNLRP